MKDTYLIEEGAPVSGTTGNEKVLFWASFLTLIAAGVGFSIRAAILGDWSKQFGFTQGELGGITGGGLVGFGITIIFFSFLADRIGYGKLMLVAFLFHASSAVVTLAATPIFQATHSKELAYWCLYVGMFLFSLGNGTCEAVINPLTATLYPRNKTHWLNILHAGWPGGLILGALLGLAFEQIGSIRWEIQMSVFLLPTFAYGLMMFNRYFPHSEARISGVTLRQMMQELGLAGAAVACVLLGLWFSDLFQERGLPGEIGWGIAAVMLLVFGSYSGFRLGYWMLTMLLVLHALVGYVELGTDSWISNITGTILENKSWGLMLFIWTSGLMFVLRFFAGPIVHQISPLGLLFVSACLGAAGLSLLGRADTAIMCILAATIYGFGKTFFWPTMLGVMSERFPRGGALTLGFTGGIGMLSAGILGGPGIGYKQDYAASTELQRLSPPAYERYKARKDSPELEKAGKNPLIYGDDDTRRFLMFPPITGLDGSKVPALLGDPGKGNGNGKGLQADIDAVRATGGNLDDKRYTSLRQLDDWWQKEGQPNAPQDTNPVKEARLHGGKMALAWTAAVPAALALGYLLLILYFRVSGGYRQVHIDEEPTGPAEY